MTNIGFFGYILSVVTYSIFLMLLGAKWRASNRSISLTIAVALTAIWAMFAALDISRDVAPASPLLQSIEALRNAFWLTFLFQVLHKYLRIKFPNRYLIGLALLIYACVLLSLLVTVTSNNVLEGPVRIVVVFQVLLAGAGLLLLEQIYRNSGLSQRFALKFLCLGLGGMYLYDFYLYSDALFTNTIPVPLWSARGYISAMIVPLVAISFARTRQWELDISVSRQFVFYTATFIGVGVYLVAVAIGGYYINTYGGSWGEVAQLSFIFAALLLLGILLYSGQFRANLKVLLSKHFYTYRYDYREEWLRLTNCLSQRGDPMQMRRQAITAIANIVESPAGLLWLCAPNREFSLAADWNVGRDDIDWNDGLISLVKFLEKWHWVVDIGGYREASLGYEDLKLPGCIDSYTPAWLIVPLLLSDELYGFILLSRSRARDELNWEVRDLLKTAGRQVSQHLALLDANRALLDSQQFDAFNRLSAFVVHDLKNLVAQLSLIGKNAERHAHNPAFIHDAFATVNNAVAKMNRLLLQLRKGNDVPVEAGPVNLHAVLEKVTANRAHEKPMPSLMIDAGSVLVFADFDKLCSVVEHIVQNAQDACTDSGKIDIKMRFNNGVAIILIEDDGMGMSTEFISNRLFRPFETTKGNAGMGIGVYETREYVQSIGGKIHVWSEPNKGTRFIIELPIVEMTNESK